MIAQIIMLLMIALMITGLTPIYITAIVGSTIAALVAGIPITGDAEVTIASMINSGLNPVIADMAGVLLFIGIMEYSGFLDVIIKEVVKIGRKIGGGTGVATAGGIAAGIIGALTGFTQPAITAVVTGPAATKLGVDPNKVAGIQAHAGHLGNFGGFTHPTMVAVVATAGIGFGKINVIGAITALIVFAVSYIRAKRSEGSSAISDAEMAQIMAEFENSDSGIPSGKAFLPFIVLFVGFVAGLPVFIVGVAASIITFLLAGIKASESEKAMLKGVEKIATPLVATLGFLYMSAVIKNIGIVDNMAGLLAPVLAVAPIQTMLLVSVITGTLTQSNGASAAVVVPFLQIVLGSGADPFAAAVAAAGGCALMQYFLTGGPVAALSTVIPVVPGSDLKGANRFQRPSILAGVAFLFILSFVL